MTNREIKLRAWDIYRRKMSGVAEVNFGDDGSALTVCFFVAPREKYQRFLVHGEIGILMHFTGKSDKNGRDIYEEDIVSFTMRLAGGLGKPKHVNERVAGEVRWYEPDANYHLVFDRPDNRATINGLIDAFGDDSALWQGQALTAETEKVRVAGKAVTAVYLVPEGYERVDDENGYTVIVKKGTKPGAPEELPDIQF